MNSSSPLLIVCFGREEADTVADLARSLGYPDAHVVDSGIADAVAALNARSLAPSYIIIDIGERGSEVLPALDEFALHCEENVRVVVIGVINDITFYRDLRQRGILEYFTRPVSASDVRSVLIQAPSSQRQAPVNAPQGTVVSFMSAASGDGSSTLATNVAYCLAVEYQQPTVLIDLDYQFGLISKSLDVSAPFGIKELFDHPDRGLDQLFINKMLVSYRDKLSIIAAPSDLRLLPVIYPEVIRELIGLLKNQFAFIVIDVPHIWTEWTAAALSYSNHAVMVAQLWLRSLTHSSRLLTEWKQAGLSQSDISLVINRSGAKFKEAISAQDFERVCRHSIAAYVANDVKAVSNAENNAKTLFEIDNASQQQQQIRELAHMIMERYQKVRTPAVAMGGAKKGLRALLEKKK